MTLRELARLHESGQRAEAQDRLLALIDDHQLAGRFAEAAAILDDPDVETLPVALQLSLLTVTKACRSKLAGARERLLSRVRERIRVDAPDRCDALLRGLE
jgi:hypothetical protein